MHGMVLKAELRILNAREGETIFCRSMPISRNSAQTDLWRPEPPGAFIHFDLGRGDYLADRLRRLRG